MKLDTILYDTARLATTSGHDHVLFQTPEGADATHTRSWTNSRGAGTLPSSESFTLHAIGVILDDTLDLDDMLQLHLGAYLSVSVANRELFRAPLAVLAQGPAHSGTTTLGSPADYITGWLTGGPYRFRNPILIKGGTPYTVTIHQYEGVGSQTDVKVLLYGDLETP